MNLVFMSSLEKDGAEGHAVSAQVTIGERHGVWNVIWNEARADGPTTQEVWYEGISWDEMLTTFRMQLQDKWLQGFSPLVEATIEGRMELSGKGRFNAMLQCYSDKFTNEAAYEKLREWRREQAQKESKAAYLVATNRVLRLISAFLPQTPEELALIPWLGEQKAKLYGPQLLAVTSAFERTTAFPLDWVEEALGEAAFEAWLREQKVLKLRTEQTLQQQKRQLLEGMARGQRVETLAAELSLSRREIVQRIETLDQEGYDIEMLLKTELELVPEAERSKARRAFELEGVRYLKPVLHRMYTEDELKALDLDRAYEWLRLMRLQYRKEKLAAA
ncbi:HRDC domain-containing protein [Paenibacillus chartarius]|uniref:HRDC domain-containing protein n=1 Tax=Paenibacillus chartarius TaxID=747481 RepID=A0ABV6DFT0_9BACL